MELELHSFLENNENLLFHVQLHGSKGKFRVCTFTCTALTVSKPWVQNGTAPCFAVKGASEGLQVTQVKRSCRPIMLFG